MANKTVVIIVDESGPHPIMDPMEPNHVATNWLSYNPTTHKVQIEVSGIDTKVDAYVATYTNPVVRQTGTIGDYIIPGDPRAWIVLVGEESPGDDAGSSYKSKIRMDRLRTTLAALAGR